MRVRAFTAADQDRMAPRPRGPNERRLCRNCDREVPRGRGRTFCDDPECVKEWSIKSNPSYARGLVRERDQGVCAFCGLDTLLIERWVRDVFRRRYVTDLRCLDTPLESESEAWDLLRAMGLRWFYFGQRSLWEMDHIVPVVEGGGACGLENLRTLCQACHRCVTRALRQRLAKAKKATA